MSVLNFNKLRSASEAKDKIADIQKSLTSTSQTFGTQVESITSRLQTLENDFTTHKQALEQTASALLSLASKEDLKSLVEDIETGFEQFITNSTPRGAENSLLDDVKNWLGDLESRVSDLETTTTPTAQPTITVADADMNKVIVPKIVFKKPDAKAQAIKPKK